MSLGFADLHHYLIFPPVTAVAVSTAVAAAVSTAVTTPVVEPVQNVTDIISTCGLVDGEFKRGRFGFVLEEIEREFICP